MRHLVKEMRKVVKDIQTWNRGLINGENVFLLKKAKMLPKKLKLLPRCCYERDAKILSKKAKML